MYGRGVFRGTSKTFSSLTTKRDQEACTEETTGTLIMNFLPPVNILQRSVVSDACKNPVEVRSLIGRRKTHLLIGLNPRLKTAVLKKKSVIFNTETPNL